MREVLGLVVYSVGHHCLLRWIVSATGGDEDAAVVCKVRAKKVEEKSMADVVNAKGGFEPVGRVIDTGILLDPGVEEECCDGWELL